MSDDFVERDGLFLTTDMRSDKALTNMVFVIDGKVEKEEPIGNNKLGKPEQYGQFCRQRMLKEALIRFLDTGGTDYSMRKYVDEVLEGWYNMNQPTYAPGEPWYLWSVAPNGASYQCVYRNDEDASVMVVTKKEWSEIMSLSDFHDLMEAQGDEQITEVGPSIPFTS